MNTALAVAGALGGIATFIGAVWVIVRAIFKQIGATEDNTKALGDLSLEVARMASQINDHAERIARLEGVRR